MIVNYLLFIGMGLYLASSLLFLFLWYRTTQTVDGIGLVFLKFLTFGLFLGSATIFLVRLFSYINMMDSDLARAIAIVNPITLLAVGLYLNYLFIHPSKKGELK